MVVVLLLGLLALFHQVVRGAVHLGDLRREATALHTSALFRCRDLPDRHARDSCLLELPAVPRDGAALRADMLPTNAVFDRQTR
jgi:hypothetical protein